MDERIVLLRKALEKSAAIEAAQRRAEEAEAADGPHQRVRIRQVRPEFFTDHVMGALPADVRLTYIGLWCVADDAGWMTWDVDQIAAQLYPYESIRSRTRRVERACEACATQAGS
jgi:hypothetical protein